MSHYPHTNFATQVLRRLDDVIAGKDVPWPISQDERALLIVIRRHIGKERAITRPQLAELLDLPDRAVRRMVRDLRENFRIAIGANREGGGYFLVATSAEAAELAQKLFKQAFSLLSVARTLGGRHLTVEWLGQARMDLRLEEEDQPKGVAA